ncbi:MAG: MBL fold metallo-hydrolase [Erysipelotrichaceae bacterium]
MKFRLLASGSKGNCCIIESNTTKLVIDCGTTKKYLTSKFEEEQFCIDEAKALLVTHAHKDHISQLKLFNDVETYASCYLETNNYHHIEPYEEFDIDNLHIQCIPLSHDSPNTNGYIIHDSKEKLVYITDTGYVSDKNLKYIEDADYYIFESNHDIEMLMETSRPYYIKTRILNDEGHLCNGDSAQLLSRIISANTKEIVLAHISAEANSCALAANTLVEKLNKMDGVNPNIRAAKQYETIIGGNNELK